MRHVADLVDLREGRGFHGIVLVGQSVDDVAQGHDRTQDTPLQDEAQHQQEQRRRDRDHGFGHRAQPLRRLARLLDGIVRALVEHVAESTDQEANALQFALVFRSEDDGPRRGVVSAPGGGDRRLLFVFQRFGPAQALFQRAQFLFVGAPVFELRDALLDRAERGQRALISDGVAGIVGHRRQPRLVGQLRQIVLDLEGKLVEQVALAHRGALDPVGA